MPFKRSKEDQEARSFAERSKSGNLKVEEYRLLPPRMLGYVPTKKLFAQFAVDKISVLNNENVEKGK